MSRLKVVYLDHCAQLSGGEIALARMLDALRDDVEAYVWLGEEGPIAERLVAAGAQVEVLPMDAGLRDTRKEAVTAGGLSPAVLRTLGGYVADIARRLRTLRPDVVHTNSLKAALYGGVAGRAARRPVLWHLRDRIASDYLPTPAVGLVRGLSYALPSAVVVNSRMTASTVPRRSTVVYDVVPDPVRAPQPPPPADGRSLVVGIVGRLAPWKGQHVFLDAFAKAAAGRDLRARLVGSAMFGEDAYERSLTEQVRALGLEDRVEFRGFRPDVEAEYAALDVVVHASTSPEPFGQVVVEAMAARRPVVAADAGGPAEVATDGVDALLVTPGDVDGYAQAIGRLADDVALRDRLAEAGLVTSGTYRPAAVARDMLAVYRTLS